MTQFIILPKQAKDITGQRFCRLVALGPIGFTKDRKIIWLCRCDCGEVTNVPTNGLTTGHTRSCGCLQREKATQTSTKHGMKGHPVYETWKDIKQRCNNPHKTSFHNYGGRGIKVHPRWHNSFEDFYEHVSQLPGYGEPDLSLDRIDNNGNYEPGNVRWATRMTQAHNKRGLHMLTHNGKTQHLASWAREIGMRPGTLYRRIYKGWSTERALTTPTKS